MYLVHEMRAIAAAGWHHERDQSMQNGFNALVPDGFNFGDAESVTREHFAS